MEQVPGVPVPAEVVVSFLVAVDALRDADDPTDPALPDPPPALLLARGTRPDVVEEVEARAARLVVTDRGLAGAPALDAAHRALARARALADERDGVVLDVVVPRALAADVTPGRAVASWFVFEHDGTDVLTHGLSRFGLPELWCGQSDEARLPMHDAVLVGVAHRLLDEWPARDPVGPATITLRDVALGYGDASAGGDDPTLERAVDLTLAYDADTDRIDVVLHDDPATLFT